MKRLRIFGISLLIVSLISRAEVHTWTSKNGHSFKGEFVQMEGGSVTLAGEEGEEVTVPLAVLDAATVELARKEAAEAEKHKPLFTHKTVMYEFEIRRHLRGIFRLTLLENGKPIPHYGKMDINIGLTEVRKTANNRLNYTGIPLKEVASEKIDRGKVTLRLIFENGVQVNLEAKTMDDGVAFSYYLEDPPDGVPELNSSMSLRFPPLLTYDMKSKSYKGVLSSTGVTFEELESFLSEYGMRVGNSRGKDQEIGFHTSPEGVRGAKFVLQTPAQRDIEFRVDQGGVLSSHFYGGRKAIEGFGIHFGTHDIFNSSPPDFSIRLK
ncbi:MAG: hypothetical protein WD708_05255 [Kiritimatiellia bacterium]